LVAEGILSVPGTHHHLGAGRINAHDLMKMIKEGKGKAELIAVEGGELWACWMAARSR
jgi:hypothetical protein